MRALALFVLVLAGCGAAESSPDLAAPDTDMATTMPGGDGGVACGNGDCLIGGDQVCCIDNAIQYCAPSGACSAGIPAYCDGPEDCPGAACCAPPGASQVVCRTQCSGTVICHGDGDCPAAAPRCCTGEGPGGYGACLSLCLASTRTR